MIGYGFVKFEIEDFAKGSLAKYSIKYAFSYPTYYQVQ